MTSQHERILSIEERYVRCVSIKKCVLCQLTDQETIIVWDEVKHEFSMNIHKVTIDNGGHDIYFCHHHFIEIQKGVRK